MLSFEADDANAIATSHILSMLQNCDHSSDSVNYLLRIINAAMNQELSSALPATKMTVFLLMPVYTKPFTTSVLLITPGQTTDVFLTANSARPLTTWQPGPTPMLSVAFDNTTTTAILQYKSASRSKQNHMLPRLPGFKRHPSATAFTNKFKSRLKSQSRPTSM
ncbi:laccase-3-like protein [Cinnamomum micranthum f. kanehirae]|uniref:Laccase-3-like protein n=1 Tax=Cinnamomum micranthum f. kanehirae TaxID=337451 RepID=A0A443NS13_9MAGN|nr:laccase-3-like protein [Cinnamomum micranthum f. kanehirae]